MSDFKIEIDSNLLESMSNELDRLGYGRRSIFDAIPIKKGKFSPVNNKIPKYNRDRYGAACCVCCFTIPVQEFEDHMVIHGSNMIAMNNNIALLFCSDKCRAVYEVNPLPYEQFTTYESIYIPGT
jgi:hypothetical protein